MTMQNKYENMALADPPGEEVPDKTESPSRRNRTMPMILLQ